MRIAASTALLVGAASAASFQHDAQHVLGGAYDAVKPAAESFASNKPLKNFEEALKGMTSEAKALWDEIKLLVPEKAFDTGSWFSTPKPHKRRPDHTWDHVVKGAEVQKLWVQDSNGESRRKVDGRLEDYNLRAKSVDPSKLGIDKVKQYSGYLDDEANDKHLFYCKSTKSYPCREDQY
jgi:cathepsin A (carboxypeptidase C)